MNVLVTGGSLGDVPVIQFLKLNGFRVVTSGNIPSDVGHQYGDGFISCDYTDVLGLVELCKKIKAVAIISSSHDLAAIAASKVADILGLPGYDHPKVSELIHNKDQLRNALHASGIQQPQYWIMSSERNLDLLETTDFPLIVKPVDLTGGNGISVCLDLYELKRSFLKAQEISPSGKVIIESFLKGTYHGVTSIIENGHVIWSFCDNEFFLYDRFRVSATTYPSSLTREQVKSIEESLSKFATFYRLVDGLLHAQILVSGQKIFVLEICRRTPGDLYPYFVAMAFNSYYIDAILSPFLGRKLPKPDRQFSVSTNSFARFMLMPDRRGVFEGVNNRFESDFFSVFPVIRENSFIEHPRKSTLAIYFLEQASTITEALLVKMKENITPRIT